MTELYHGNILYSETREKLAVYEDSYLAVENGRVEGIYPCIPEKYRGIKVEDFGRRTIIPAFSDLHSHAAQYVQRGIGMDLLLEDWLNRYTFPQEARFADMAYACAVYDAFVGELIRHGTFHSVIFATIHRRATEYLVQKLEEKGLFSYVGKVCMDMNSPAYLSESTEESLRETECFLEHTAGNKTAKPILTPRFAPTCTDELLKGLGCLARKYQAGCQTHVVESKWEAQEAVKLHSDCLCDTELYEKYGLMDNGPFVAAHFIYPSERDTAILRKHRGYAVHCPDATANVIAGIMPLAHLGEEKVNRSLGSDIAAGHFVGIYRQIARAVQFSKLKEFYEPEENRTVTFAEAFYLGTRGGGSLFGKTGAFEKEYAFDALVIEDLSDAFSPLTPAQNIERFCYAGDDRHIFARFLGGKRLI